MRKRIISLLKEAAGAEKKRALPILSFPATQKLGVTIGELVGNAELQAQAMQTVANTTDTLAAVSLIDLSVEAEAFCASVRFAPDEVPSVTEPLVSDSAAADALTVPTLEAGRVPVCVEGIRLAAEKITDKPVLAGMIGPFSLAGRLIDVTEIMYLCYDDPQTVHTVLKKATAFLIEYAGTFRRAGASGIIMAEPLTGIMSPDLASEFSVPYVKEVIDAVQNEDFSVIYHNCGDAVCDMADEIFSQGAAAYHFGDAVAIERMLEKAPQDTFCMGNIPPVEQFVNGTPDSMTLAVNELLDRCEKYPGFVISSGCDIPIKAKWENIDAFFKAVGEWRPKDQK